MQHKFIWNTHSFDAVSDDRALEIFENTFHGLIDIAGEGDTAALYFDKDTELSERKISESKKVSDFIQYLTERNEEDLLFVLTELVDKADAINSLDLELFNEAVNSCYYFSHLGYTGSVDFLALAAVYDGILFTANSNEFWSHHRIEVGQYQPGATNQENGFVYSVCNSATAQEIINVIRPPYEEIQLNQLIPNCVISAELLEWFNQLDKDNKRITKNKLKIAHDLNFNGGEPLFKTLNDASGMRELRYSAFPGGATRILFGSLPNSKFGLLIGFIKKSNSEGYEVNIPRAEKIWNLLKN